MLEATNNSNSIRTEYLAHIESRPRSGLSIKQYCENNNLIEHKFNYYKNYKLRKNKSSYGKKQNIFAKVKIKKELTKATDIVTASCGDKIDIDPTWLASFITALNKLK